MQLSPTESRERESRGSKTLWRGQGAAPLRSPINTRILYAVATNSIAKKGVQRVEDPLAGSRGSAPCASLLYLLFLRESRGKGEKDVDKFHRNGYDREDNRIIRDGSCGRGLHG